MLLQSPLTQTQGIAGADKGWMIRLTAPDGTGANVPGEGNTLAPADVSTITCTVYDLMSLTPNVGQSVSITSAAITSTLSTANNWLQVDTIGADFKHTVPGSYFPTPEHVYRIYYQIVTTGNSTLIWYHDHTTQPQKPQ